MKADKIANAIAGNLAVFDAQGNLADGGMAKSDVESLFFAQYYPEGNVKSSEEFTQGIKYDIPDTVNRTITVKPFCNTGRATNDNSSLVGCVVIPPFVDSDGNGYISDNGTRFKVVGVSGYSPSGANTNLTVIVAPNTVTAVRSRAFSGCSALATVSIPATTTIGDETFNGCDMLTSVSLPATTTIGDDAFSNCSALTSVSLPATTAIGQRAFNGCSMLTSVSLPAITVIGGGAFIFCVSLFSVDFGDTPRPFAPTLDTDVFYGVPTTCKIIVPDAQYAAWIATPGWSDLVTAGYKFIRHSEWEYARKYEVVDKTTLTRVLTPFKGLIYDDGYDVDIDTVVSALV